MYTDISYLRKAASKQNETKVKLVNPTGFLQIRLVDINGSARIGSDATNKGEGYGKLPLFRVGLELRTRNRKQEEKSNKAILEKLFAKNQSILSLTKSVENIWIVGEIKSEPEE
jgi:hypothetical protein